MLLLDDANGNINLCAPSGDANLPALGENTPNEHTDAEKMVEHMAIFEFVDYSKATTATFVPLRCFKRAAHRHKVSFSRFSQIISKIRAP